MVAFAIHDHLEAADGFLERHVLARAPREHFGHVERLRQEALHLPRTGHGQLVFGGQFVHAENRDDVAEFLVALERSLHGAGGGVVLFAHDVRVHLTAGGVQRVHGGVDAESGDVSRQHDGGVQVRKRGGRRRVGQVVRGHVHGLDRRDGTHLGGGDAFLQLAHLLGQRRLVAHGGRHPAQQGGHFGTGQGVAVDVVDEEQDVPAFVAEGLGDGQTRQGHAQAVAGRLVHLTVHHRHLGVGEVFQVHDLGVRHLVVEVVALTGALTHAGEHGKARVRLRNVVDELHHVHGLAHAGAAEQSHLAALGERADEVDHLDAGFEQVLRGRQLVVGGRGAVDRRGLFVRDRAALVDRVPEHVHDAAQGGGADRDGDGLAGVSHGDTAAQAVGGAQRNGADDPVTELLLHFERQRRALELERVVDVRDLVTGKLHVDHSADALNDLALCHFAFLQSEFVACRGLSPRWRRRRRRSPTAPW